MSNCRSRVKLCFVLGLPLITAAVMLLVGGIYLLTSARLPRSEVQHLLMGGLEVPEIVAVVVSGRGQRREFRSRPQLEAFRHVLTRGPVNSDLSGGGTFLLEVHFINGSWFEGCFAVDENLRGFEVRAMTDPSDWDPEQFVYLTGPAAAEPLRELLGAVRDLDSE